MADLVRTLTETHFAAPNGELLVGGIPIGYLAEKYGTPLFLYDRSVADSKFRALSDALPAGFRISYSVKANPNIAVLKHFLAMGCGLEVASAGELGYALEAGCDPESILFAGPGKTEAELEFALSQRIGELHAESLTEIGRISRICRQLGVRGRIAIRVNPADEAEGGAMRMGGRPAPFGVDEEALEQTLNVVLASEWLDFTGIHLFSGTQILDAKVLTSQYAQGIKIARRAAGQSGRPLRRVDFGGGLGILYFGHEKELDLREVSKGLASLFADVHSDPLFRGTQFLVEPGRFLIGEAGIYVTRINDIKTSRGKKFLIVDGGMNHHLAASGNLGQTIKRNYPVALLQKLAALGEKDIVDVVGPLCTPLDTLARSVGLPQAEIGDLFGIFQSGAYGWSASPLGFLSHPAPPEVWVDSGRDFLIRPRGEAPHVMAEPERYPFSRNLR